MEPEKIIDNLLASSNNHLEILYECITQKQFNILKLLCILYKNELSDNSKFQDIYKLSFLNDIEGLEKYIKKSSNLNTKKVLLLCNWCSSNDLCNLWNKMSKDDYIWNDIEIIWDGEPDYYCVINSPPNNVTIDMSKCIYFPMEPNMDKHPERWGAWANPKSEELLFCGTPDLHFSNTEWHLSKTYEQLMTEKITKNEQVCNILSTVLSDKYADLGHQRRVDFVKFLETKGMHVDVFGGNRFLWNNYKGSLPYHKKDDALFPYKYTFNCENHSNKNYCTEKLYDGILAEC